MDRFSKVCMGIRNVNPNIAMHHLVSAVLPGRFTESLIKQSPCNMDELRTRDTKFMQIEEHIDYHMKTQVEIAEKERERNRGTRPPMTRTNQFRSNRGPRFHHYTPLTVPRGKVLDEALQAELISTLKQAQTPHNADTTKRCQYHRNYDHTAKGCQALKDKIEELVQAGHLCKFVKTRSPQRDTDYSRDKEHFGQKDNRSCNDYHRTTWQK